MVKLRCYASVGISGATREETYDIPDAELEGLNEKERNEVFEAYLDTFIQNHCDMGYHMVDEGEEE